ncbi:hypothetical protein WAI453_011463 [Rhynchosporium graminicola]|uniref:Uncharacterized protein n=1 Tax=Rhynchosporium graminicola TaxID=2792576 RepID=A0A1E1L1M8_9HELO|nr:uncharacterized protein RCO7_10023 [Rhynchosporium commune]
MAQCRPMVSPLLISHDDKVSRSPTVTGKPYESNQDVDLILLEDRAVYDAPVTSQPYKPESKYSLLDVEPESTFNAELTHSAVTDQSDKKDISLFETSEQAVDDAPTKSPPRPIPSSYGPRKLLLELLERSIRPRPSAATNQSENSISIDPIERSTQPAITLTNPSPERNASGCGPRNFLTEVMAASNFHTQPTYSAVIDQPETKDNNPLPEQSEQPDDDTPTNPLPESIPSGWGPRLFAQAMEESTRHPTVTHNPYEPDPLSSEDLIEKMCARASVLEREILKMENEPELDEEGIEALKDEYWYVQDKLRVERSETG